MILRQQRPIFRDRPRGVAQLLGQPRHQRVRALVADRDRNQRGGLLERLERRPVALLRERLPEASCAL